MATPSKGGYHRRRSSSQQKLMFLGNSTIQNLTVDVTPIMSTSPRGPPMYSFHCGQAFVTSHTAERCLPRQPTSHAARSAWMNDGMLLMPRALEASTLICNGIDFAIARHEWQGRPVRQVKMSLSPRLSWVAPMYGISVSAIH